jgi:hypothetical protein
LSSNISLRSRLFWALERVDELRRRHRGVLSGAGQAESAARSALARDRRAHEAAHAVHKEAADLHEERVRELSDSGDEMAARRAQKRADAARERDHRAG